MECDSHPGPARPEYSNLGCTLHPSVRVSPEVFDSVHRADPRSSLSPYWIGRRGGH